LEVVAEFHLGELVNRFQHGSLTMQLMDGDAAPLPTLLYGTVNGVIGVIATIPEEVRARARTWVEGGGELVWLGRRGWFCIRDCHRRELPCACACRSGGVAVCLCVPAFQLCARATASGAAVRPCCATPQAPARRCRPLRAGYD